MGVLLDIFVGALAGIFTAAIILMLLEVAVFKITIKKR